MSKADLSIPYRELLMILPNPQILEEPPLPEGYSLAEDIFKHETQWQQLMCRLNLFKDQSQAETVWNAMKKQDREYLSSHVWMVLDPDRNVCAACGLWPGKHFENKYIRIHYLGVDENFQNLHLGRWLVQHCISEFAREQKDLKDQDECKENPKFLYLSTQAQSWPAILLYGKAGFKPYTGAYKNHTASQSLADWKQAAEIIRKKSGREIRIPEPI